MFTRMLTSLPLSYTYPSGATEKEATLKTALLIGLVVAALLALGIYYLVSYLKNRGKPPIERKGANLLGGAYGNGYISGRPSGAGSFGGVPGSSIPVIQKNKAEEAEDPRKR